MKKILVAMLIATMMLLALGTAEDVTKSTTTETSTTPGSDAVQSSTTTTSMNPGPDATKSTTTTTSRLAMGERGVRVTLAKGANWFHLMAPEFGVGRPKEAAALARFAGASGLGDVQEIFDFLVALPADYDDVIPLPFSQEFFFLEP